MFGLVILGGTIVEGSGKEGFCADVGIAGEKIAAIGPFTLQMGRWAFSSAWLMLPDPLPTLGNGFL